MLIYETNNYMVTILLGSDSDTLFSWGAGAKFNVTQSLNLFVDYADLGKNDAILETSLSSWGAGFSYKF